MNAKHPKKWINHRGLFQSECCIAESQELKLIQLRDLRCVDRQELILNWWWLLDISCKMSTAVKATGFFTAISRHSVICRFFKYGVKQQQKRKSRTKVKKKCLRKWVTLHTLLPADRLENPLPPTSGFWLPVPLCIFGAVCSINLSERDFLSETNIFTYGSRVVQKKPVQQLSPNLCFTSAQASLSVGSITSRCSGKWKERRKSSLPLAILVYFF